MERRQIRRRWQVTIPRELRQRLNLFIGQLLNFDLVREESGYVVRVLFGTMATEEDMGAWKETGARRERKRLQHRSGSKIRKSDTQKMLRGRRIEGIRQPSFLEATELKGIISNLSQYLLALQARLNG